MPRTPQQNATRNINRRIERVAENLGTDSPIYQDYQKQLEYLFPDNIVMKDGVVQLVRPAQLNLTDLNQLNIEGIAQIEKGLRQSYKQYKKESGDDISLRDYINAQSNITQNLGALYEQYKNAEHQKLVNKAREVMQQKGEKKTHKQIVSIGQMINELQGKPEKDIDWLGIKDLINNGIR